MYWNRDCICSENSVFFNDEILCIKFGDHGTGSLLWMLLSRVLVDEMNLWSSTCVYSMNIYRSSLNRITIFIKETQIVDERQINQN